MKFYRVRDDRENPRTGHVDAAGRWLMPSIECAVCGGYGGFGEAYPTVDLSTFPERAALERPRCLQAVSLEEYRRLSDLLRPLVPRGAPLEPGTSFGPFEGTASGRFGDFSFMGASQPFAPLETMEKLQGAGLRGLAGARADLRFRGKNPPTLLALEIQVHGELHPVCFPESWQEPCARCGRLGNRLPEGPVLKSATLPADVDLFRLRDFKTVVIATERFVEAVHRLRLEDIAFQELPVR